MAREVDERKKRAALRKLRRAAELAEQGLGPPLSDWEREFLEEVEGRIEKFGSAFADPMKGSDGEALSSLQQAKLREIDKKARGKSPKGFGARKSQAEKPGTGKPKSGKSGFGNAMNKPRRSSTRQIDEDIDTDDETASVSPEITRFHPKLVSASALLPPNPPSPPSVSPPPPPARPAFKVIRGGKNDADT